MVFRKIFFKISAKWESLFWFKFNLRLYYQGFNSRGQYLLFTDFENYKNFVFYSHFPIHSNTSVATIGLCQSSNLQVFVKFFFFDKYFPHCAKFFLPNFYFTDPTFFYFVSKFTVILWDLTCQQHLKLIDIWRFFRRRKWKSETWHIQIYAQYKVIHASIRSMSQSRPIQMDVFSSLCVYFRLAINQYENFAVVIVIDVY